MHTQDAFPTRFVWLYSLWLLTGGAGLATAGMVFQDGFESGTLGPAWTVTTTGDGRARVSTEHGPASGGWHLILDDSVNDAVYSVVECTLQLDLSNKKNVVLSFKAKSLGNEPHSYPYDNPRAFDGVSVSFDAGASWQRYYTTYASVSLSWETFSIQINPRYYDEPFGQDVRIRFSEYDNASAPLDGIAIDDVTVTAEDDLRAMLEIPTRVLEGSGPHTGYVLLSFAPTNALVVTLSAPAPLSVPAMVEVPTGQTLASFSFSVLDDSLVNLSRAVTVYATASGVTSIPSYVTVLDDDLPKVTLNVPTQLTEGLVSNGNASVTLNRAPDVPLNLSLSETSGELTGDYYSITIPPGQTQAVFTVNAYDDTKIDGDILVTLTARHDGVAVAANQLMVLDNEKRSLSLTLPASVQEGMNRTGTVSIAGTLPTNLTVRLISTDLAALPLPALVTLVAGETQATFPLAPTDNSLRDSSRNVTITASADTFAGTSQTVTIRDNEVAGYRFSPLNNIVNVSSPLRIRVSAEDVEGDAISNYTGVVNLSVVLTDGATLPLMPASVSLAGATGWTGEVRFPTVTACSLRLRASDGSGNAGDSAPFDLMRTVDLMAAADLVWDSARSRFYATVSSTADAGTNANRLVVIDPATAAIAAGLQLAQDPGQLALTSGGESLYVALNGNGSIVRIDPANLTAVSSFAVGSDPTYGTFYARDMCTVIGQPDTLVISRGGVDDYQHYGVAVYDNGVARLTNTPFLNGSRVIEPSADPTVFFGYDNRSDFGFRRLRLDAAGVTEIEVNRTLLNEYGVDMLSDGNAVFSTSGVALDGARMQRLGAFPMPGPLRPDLAAHRVYFIEQQSSWPGLYDRISAYDPVMFTSIRKLTMSSPVDSPTHLLRWGTNGLAFLTRSNVVLINSSQLVPDATPANLAVVIAATPNPTVVAVPVTYSVVVSNQGPNAARNLVLETELSAFQSIQGILTTNGTPVAFSNSISLRAGDLAPGATAKLAITTMPESAGTLRCMAKATSESPDSDFADNTATNLVSVGYQLGLDTVSPLRLAANNLIYDPTRTLLWASVAEADPFLRRCVVSINPLTGVISEPIAIGGYPRERCMALSANGRYLYIGLTDSPEVHRLDLASGNASVRIALDLSQWGNPYAQDIETLDGDGTGFLVALDTGAAAFDSEMVRSNHTSVRTSRLERTGAPGGFIGAYYSTLSKLSVTASGVEVIQSANGVIPGGWEIRGDGDLVLASSGHLINASNLTLRANLGITGTPCLDSTNHSAYLVNGNTLYGFDTGTLLLTGNLTLPVTAYGEWVVRCVRWGLDGFAILGNDGLIYVLRWSSTIPASTDSDTNGLSDAWEAMYFNSLNVDPAEDADGDGLRNFLEYLFTTSPMQPSANPVQVAVATVGDQRFIKLVFPRRAGLSPRPYDYTSSSDLAQWTTLASVSENVLSTHSVDGVSVETVEALIPATDPVAGYVRFQWNPR